MKNFADCHIHITDLNFDQINRMLDTLADWGVTDVAALGLPYRSIAHNLCALYQKMTYKRMRVYAFGGLHRTDRFANVPYEEQVKTMLDMGFDGIKLIDMCAGNRMAAGCGIDDPKYDKAFVLLQERGTPIVMHVADPASCWEEGGRCANGKYLPRKQYYEETFKALDKFPRLNLVLAHFGYLSDDIDEATRVLEKYPNLKLDLTPGQSMFVDFSKDIERWREFFIKYQDRILFGTDSNSNKNINFQLHEMVYTALTHEGEFGLQCYWVGRKVQGLHLPESVVEKICYHNFVNLIGGKAAKVDEEAFYTACETLLKELRGNPRDEISEALAKDYSFVVTPEKDQAVGFLEEVLARREAEKEEKPKKTRIVFFGDSMTDSGRERQAQDGMPHAYGRGYVILAASELLRENPRGYEIFNRGNSGDRIYQLYSRLKKDVWNLQPDVLNIMVGINDVESPWNTTGTDIKRWEKIYRAIIEETKERFPNVQIILCEEPVIYANEELSRDYFWRWEKIPQYAKLLKAFAKDYGCKIVWLNDKMNTAAKEYGWEKVLYDGTHPTVLAAKIIAEEWLKVFREMKI